MNGIILMEHIRGRLGNERRTVRAQWAPEMRLDYVTEALIFWGKEKAEKARINSWFSQFLLGLCNAEEMGFFGNVFGSGSKICTSAYMFLENGPKTITERWDRKQHVSFSLKWGW